MHDFQYKAVLVTAMMLFLSATAAQTVHRYEWEIEYFDFSPDCNASASKDVLGVHQIAPTEIQLKNFPGPTIRAQEGDRIEVNVTNKIRKWNPYDQPPERVAIHWHGIRQLGSPWSDGSAGLTECGIPQNASKLYNFTVDRPGTYLWHGHYGPQRAAGLYGLLLIDPRDGALVPTFDGEFAITLNDWWHADIYNQTDGLDPSTKWKWVNNPQSFLIKGDSAVPACEPPHFCPSAELNCTTNKLNPVISGAGKLIWNVLPGKTYIVRMASATSFAFLNFVIEGHVMTVLEADGYLVQPFNTTSIDILSGQTYALTLTTKAEHPQQRVYHVGVNARDRIADSKKDGGTDPGLAVLSYNLPYANRTVNLSSQTDYRTLWETEPEIQLGGPRYNDSSFSPYFANQVRALAGYSYPVPKVGDRNISFLISQIRVQYRDEYQMRWALNNVSYETNISSGNKTPLLTQLVHDHAEIRSNNTNLVPVGLKKLSKSDITDKRMYNMTPDAIKGGYYLLKKGEIVTVILQNAAMYNTTNSEAHPWHLHGHDFWVLSYGSGLYDPETSPQEFNLEDPPVRNTVPVFGLGWVAIRFIADNPGVWSFHCHNEWHMHLGMMVVFVYGIDDIDPNQVPTCQ